MIEAVAGSGKTYTIVESLKLFPSSTRILFAAFNKHIADDIKKKVPAYVDVMTLNGLGWRACMSALGRRIVLDEKKVKNIIERFSSRGEMYEPVKKIVSMLKANGAIQNYESMPKAEFVKVIEGIVIRYSIDLKKITDDVVNLVRNVYELAAKNTNIMDFDDQIFMPVKHDWPLPKYDVVMVDEAQDLTRTQIQLLAKIGARVIAVGDRHQSIYGFRGADPESMDHMQRTFNMIELPLSICYRCPKSHVKLASEIVPQIEAYDCAITGDVDKISDGEIKNHVRRGDLIICRTNAPLISVCLQLISSGINAKIKGRDFAKGLVRMVKSVQRISSDMNSFLDILSNRVQKESEELEAAGRSSDVLMDKFYCIKTLSKLAKTPDELVVKIESIFNDETVPAVSLSSIHRAKGLEAENVFFMAPDLIPHPMVRREWAIKQEWNLKYVGLTRAKKKMYFVDI